MSLAVQATVVVPTGNIVPDGGEHKMFGWGSILSVAVTVYVTRAPEGLVRNTLLSAGNCSNGGVES
jgi:hypothetical protein